MSDDTMPRESKRGAPPAVVRVRVNGAAMTRVEYSKIVEVPVAMAADAALLQSLADALYEDIDCDHFHEDLDYWEKSACYAEPAAADDKDKPEFRAAFDAATRSFDIEELHD